ncbi:biopolymer transporter ExbD [Oscillatoria sp. FACHB-1407]|uniref:ExbD/TolR family protein n=1 Tax=Oscillatoria sp. FACHB-1407 TaxID=2692847 RepID=UPI001688DF0E|nr:biopolymer transporter ExbD [Oscillatoria sp. FACHB-1407]MBD2464507.1 biopolymer transporter ExbD [Oscillatoria sp. FACHB-1407]
MRFRDRNKNSQMLEIELTPMLNVMMGILAFFVMITMTLTVEQGVEVELPNSAENAPPTTAEPDPLIVQLDAQGQLLLNNQPFTEDQLSPQIQAYLTSNRAGFVVLQASPDLPYEQVIRLLGDLKEIGGDRVSLAIE